MSEMRADITWYLSLVSYILIRFLLAEGEEPVRPDSDVDVEDPPLVEDSQSEGTVGPSVFAIPD